MSIRVPTAPTRAADGTLYVEDWRDGVDQVYSRDPGVPPGGSLRRLTGFEDGVDGYWLSPDDATIVVAAAVGGSEQTDLYRLEPVSGEIEPLLADPDVYYRFGCWLRDGSGFIFAANDERPSDFHLYRFDLEARVATKLLGREGSWSAVDATSDGRVLVGRYTSASRADAYELDTSAGLLRSLNRGEGAYNRALGYLPGEEHVALVSDAVGGVRRLYIRAFEDGAFSRPLPELQHSNVEGGAINPERTLAAVLHNEDGYRSMRLLRLPSLESVTLPSIERGLVGRVSIRGPIVTWTNTTARDPGRTWTWNADTGGEPVALTAVDDRGIDLDRFPLPRLVAYRSFDGLEVPAFLHLPPEHVVGTSIPFVVHFHGGPESQHRPRFDRFVQYLLSRGFGVLQPNVRGSTGYGREYHMMDNYRNREASVRDGVEAARWLVAERYAEAGHIAAYGRSYGGFMAVAAVIADPHTFGASVEIVGIVNFETFLAQTGAYRRALREVEYGPLSDPQFLRSVSPIHRIDEIHVPMLIAHGLNDPRVPVGEAMQLAVGLQKRGADPELVFFPDEGHRIAKLENRVLLYERVVRFLERTIR